MPEMTIGKLAQRAGVNVESIRYYQRLQLLEEPGKPLGGVLKELIGRCDRRRGKVACPIIESLARQA